MENFYLIYGLDKSLVQLEVDNILKKLKITDVVKYDMTNSDLIDVVEDASTIGLFQSKKVIILDDCTFLSGGKSVENLEVLENYVEKYNPNNYCILVAYVEKVDTRKKIYKLLSKHRVIELKKIDDDFLRKYVMNFLQEEQYKMEDVDYFLSVIGKNLDNVQNELNKLIHYKVEDKYISNVDVDKIVMKSLDEEIFALTDAIVYQNMTEALMLLNEFLNKNYDEMQIIMLLASQFRFMFQVKRLLGKGKSEGEIAKILEVNPYRVKFTIKKLYSYSEEMLLDYIKRIAKMDHDIKLGIMDKKLALELFIIDSGK